MFLKDVYKKLSQNAICEQLHYTLNSNPAEFVEFMSELDKKTEDFTPKQWDELINKIQNSPNKITFTAMLLECENLDKHIAIELAKSTSYDFILFKRYDLEKEDIKEITSFIKPARMKELLKDENIFFYPCNITELCSMIPSYLKKIDYLPYSRIQDTDIITTTVTNKLKTGDCNELFCTAIINNKNLYDKTREDAFNIAYDPTKITSITPKIAEELYPMMMEVAYDKTFEKDIDYKYANELSNTLISIIKNNEFTTAQYKDLAMRQIKECYAHMIQPLSFLALNTTDSIVLSELQKIPNSDVWGSVIKNPAYDMSVLRAMGDKWFYANPSQCQDKINFEKKFMMLRSLYCPFGHKFCNTGTLCDYIDKYKDDKLFIKTVILAPTAKGTVLNYIKNHYVPTLKTEEEKEEIKALIAISKEIDSYGFHESMSQYIATQLLLENLKNDKDVPMTRDCFKGIWNRGITYSEFVDIHKDIDKIDVAISHSALGGLGKFIFKLQKEFPNCKKLTEDYHKVYEKLQNEQKFHLYKTKWVQFFKTPENKERFYGDKIHTSIRMDRINKLKDQPILLSSFINDTIENCKQNGYFAEKIYEVINHQFKLDQLRTENYKILLENMKLFAPMYHEIEEIVYENRFKNNQISQEEYNDYKNIFYEGKEEKTEVER